MFTYRFLRDGVFSLVRKDRANKRDMGPIQNALPLKQTSLAEENLLPQDLNYTRKGGCCPPKTLEGEFRRVDTAPA